MNAGFQISFDVNLPTNIALEMNEPRCEVVINGRKYNHKKGILYHLRDKNDPRTRGAWSFAKWCAYEITDISMNIAFLRAYIETFSADGRQNWHYAIKLFKLENTIPHEASGRVVWANILTDKLIAAYEHLDKVHNRRDHRMRDILFQALLECGATEEEAARGYAPCPITGEPKYLKGYFGLLNSQNSPDAIPFYFKYGKLDGWITGERKPLFVNPTLRAAHYANNWSARNNAGNGRWTYDPDAAAAVSRPPQEMLEQHELQTRPGFRNARNRQINTIPSRTAPVVMIN